MAMTRRYVPAAAPKRNGARSIRPNEGRIPPFPGIAPPPQSLMRGIAPERCTSDNKHMRHVLPGIRRIGAPVGAIAAVVGALALAAPGVALASNRHGPKIDDAVAQAAAMTSTTTPIPVIVFG